MWGGGKSMYQIQATVAMEQQHMTTDQASHYAATAAGPFFSTHSYMLTQFSWGQVRATEGTTPLLLKMTLIVKPKQV